MRFEYTGRHVEVSPGIRKHVEDHFKSWNTFLTAQLPRGLTPLLTLNRTRHNAELIVHWRDHTLTVRGHQRGHVSST